MFNEELKQLDAILEFLNENPDVINNVLDAILPLARNVISKVQGDLYALGTEMANQRAEYYHSVFTAFMNKNFTREETMLIMLSNKVTAQEVIKNLSNNKK